MPQEAEEKKVQLRATEVIQDFYNFYIHNSESWGLFIGPLVHGHDAIGCMQIAKEEGDPELLRLADLTGQLSLSERTKLVKAVQRKASLTHRQNDLAALHLAVRIALLPSSNEPSTTVSKLIAAEKSLMLSAHYAAWASCLDDESYAERVKQKTRLWPILLAARIRGEFSGDIMDEFIPLVCTVLINNHDIWGLNSLYYDQTTEELAKMGKGDAA